MSFGGDGAWLTEVATAVGALVGDELVRVERDAVVVDTRPLALVVRVGPPSLTLRGVAVVVEADDGDEAFASMMDLVVATLGGAVVLRELVRRGTVVRRAVELDPASGRPIQLAIEHTAGPRFGRSASHTIRNAIDGLPVPSDVVRPPWAPWLGLGGFTRRAGDQPQSVEVDGVLDLHQHRPKDVGRLVNAYLDACIEARIGQVRIIHGKGKGVLRRTVHSLLERRDDVARFELAGIGAGGWGATLVDLQLPELLLGE